LGESGASLNGFERHLLRIGSRGSALALTQARLVADALMRYGVDSAIVVITTEGDTRAPDTPWGEGAFVTAIEAALLDRRIDIAVHSAKDLPTDEDGRLLIAAFLPRASAADAIVLPAGSQEIESLVDLPRNARVGTDSPRRTAFLRALRPDLIFHGLHGNVDTRLRRLDAGDSDILVLAEAGLDRLGRSDRISLRLDPGLLPPAPGQGALAVQVRASDVRALEAVRALDDPGTRRAVEVERALLAATGGGCRAPIGAFARESEGGFDLIAGYAREDGDVRIIVRQATHLASAAPGNSPDTDRPDTDGPLVLAALQQLADEATRTAIRSNWPRVIVTRAADQAAPLALSLVDRGLAPLVVPAIEIAPGDTDAIDAALGRLSTFDWVVVTSANTVQALRAGAHRAGISLQSPALHRPRWAAVGNATKRALAAAGIEVALVAKTSSANALLAELPVEAGARVLFPRSDVADAGPVDRLTARGVAVDAPVAYRTIEAPDSSIVLLRDALELGPIATVLTSGSTARGLLALGQALGAGARVLTLPTVCIGPETGEQAEELGYHVAAIEPMQRIAGIADSVARSIFRSEVQELPMEVTR
jgi:hydroxymethylbilane synthase